MDDIQSKVPVTGEVLRATSLALMVIILLKAITRSLYRGSVPVPQAVQEKDQLPARSKCAFFRAPWLQKITDVECYIL
jgi:hypothetical protein